MLRNRNLVYYDHVVSHDRGSRVIPTLHLHENVDRKFAEAWFCFFLTSPAPVPETFISDNPEFFMKLSFFGKPEMVEPKAFQHFVRTMSRPGPVHAQCEDYRAASTIDLDAGQFEIAILQLATV